MNNEELLKKLRIKPDMKYAVVNRPSDFSDFPDEDGEIKNKKQNHFDALILFIVSQKDLHNQLQKFLPALSPATIFWISYPKRTGGMATDLNRDILWQSLGKYGYTAVSQISLNLKWSSLWFKPRENVIRKKYYTPSIDLVKRIVKIPKELKPAFRKNKKAEEFFKSLSFTHKKEYVLWIESAKKEETKRARVVKTVEMLNRGLKSR